MTQGILYFNQGSKCMIRLLVSLYSLRRHYKGAVTLVQSGKAPDWFLDAARHMGAKISLVNTKGLPPLVYKARMQDITPYDVTMFIDADTLVNAPVDEYFEKIKEHTFCTGAFASWKTTGGTISRRIKKFKSIAAELVPGALQYGAAVNTGVFGFTKDAAILPKWKKLTEDAWRHQCSRIPDEVACQMLLPEFEHWLAPVEWGVSVKYGTTSLEDAKIIHYHGRKHVHPFDLCDVWKQVYWQMYHELTLAKPYLHTELRQAHGDRRLTRYLKTIGRNLTIVTAVNEKYLSKLRANFDLWLKTEGIFEHPMILFVHGIPESDKRLDFIRHRARIINWDMPDAANERELMLSAFVFGTAEHVTTRWWLKLDADATPKPEIYKGYSYRFKIPAEGWDKDIYGHRWGYTKSKGRYKKEHFLNILDTWWKKLTGEDPIFPANLPLRERVSHKRLASFVCLHKTAFTKYCADLCSENRLPVPSHDTFMWYVAERSKKHSWGTFNAKRYFAP